jgi:hypothetical protein
MFVGILYQPNNTTGICFAKDIFAMGFNGPFAQEQAFRNLLVA